jgi:hypothetical protein
MCTIKNSKHPVVRCHDFAAFQNALPPIIKSTPADLEITLPSLPRTGPTHPPEQDLQRDTRFLENSNKPRCQLALPIRPWLPFPFQDLCFFSTGGQFLSFPGFNLLLHVTLLQPVQPFTHKCTPKSPNLAIHQQVESTSKTTATVSLEIQLLHLEKKMEEIHNILPLHPCT